MMGYYFVKRDLPGVPAGRVERFAHARANTYVANGDIAPYDERLHSEKPGADAVPEGYRKTAGKCPACGK